MFCRDFVENRVRKVTASLPSIKKLAPWATWSLLRYFINERINYLTQFTEFPLVQDSLALMDDDIIDNAILRAGGLPLAPSDSLSHLTMFTLCSIPCDLGGLGIRRFGSLVSRKVHSLASGRGHSGLLAPDRVGRGRESGVDSSGRLFSR